MDHIELTLQLGPVPYLHLSFTIFKTIWAAVGEAEDSKEQLKVLAGSVAHLLYALDRQYREGKLNDDATLEALIDLESLLKEISAFIQKQDSNGFFRSLIQKEDRLSSIEAYHRRIATSVNAFQLAALMDIHRWQAKNDEARMIDQKRLHAHLHELEANQRLLIDALSVVQNSPMAMMATLRRRLEERRGDQEELRFMIHSLRYLMTMSGQQVDIKPWTITSFDVEFGPLIGAGGFGKVYRGKWNYTDVALKVMNGMEGITPRAAAIRHEIDTWSRLRHPNIIQFLGANILDDTPFLVMPLIEHGNARDFIDNNPDCNRLKIIHQASLGLTYLHSQKVIHGDLKAVNVLIDEGEKAMLCDFGLARIKADVNSRVTTAENNTLLGSQNWMAPELFEGRLLRFPCDIYSFAMTAYEIFTHEIPFGNVSPAHLSKLVVKRNARPDRPSTDEAPQMTNAVWDIIEQSWSKNPADRPTASLLCEKLATLLTSPRSPTASQTASSSGSSADTVTLPDSLSFMSDYNPEIHTAFRFGIPNAHLPSPSRDSSPDVQAYTSKRLPPTPRMDSRKRLVIAFDIGTASSGISYSILEPGQPIEIKGVNTFPDGKQSSTLSKVPTTIYYDRAGNIRAIGATTLSKDISKFAENNEWTKVKWFKLHLWPRFLPSYESTRGHWSLPANKEAVDILTDYLQYLHRCVLGYLEKAHVNGHEIWRSISADDIRFVFSYPNGWNGVQDQMRKAAVMADLIPNSDAGHARISFVTEGQANLHFVMKHGIPTQITETRDAVVVVVDAGDYMVNISSYVRSASAGLPYEEMTQAQCHFCGSIFISSHARAFIKCHLTRSKYKDNLDTMVQYFDRHIKFRFRNSEQPEWLVFGSPSDNEKRCNIRNGQLKLSGSDVASFFHPSIECIIRSVKELRGIGRMKFTHVVLLGELSASEWIYKQVSESLRPLGYSIIRPDYYVNKSVADGAIYHYIDNM